jgi:hypothetical protein
MRSSAGLDCPSERSERLERLVMCFADHLDHGTLPQSPFAGCCVYPPCPCRAPSDEAPWQTKLPNCTSPKASLEQPNMKGKRAGAYWPEDFALEAANLAGADGVPCHRKPFMPET